MRAVVFRPSPVRRLLVRTLGGLTRSVRWGRLSGVSLEELEDPPLPGPGWVRLEVLKAGISRDDLREIDYAGSPLLEPFASWPAVPGREILGRVEEVGEGVERVAFGDRVAVDPFLSCHARGFAADPCPPCARGLAALCARAGEEGRLRLGGRPLRRGLRLGLHADLPGGWSEAIVAHESQLLPVEGALPDRAAVLVEPLARALHAVLSVGVGGGVGDREGAPGPEPGPDAPALVLGGGAPGLATVHALRVLGFRGEVVVRTEREGEGELALRLGADGVADDEVELREAMAGTGARAYMPLEGEEVWAGGGFSPVFDWSGTGPGLARALRLVAPGGRMALSGAARPPGGELALATARQVTLVGVAGYGPRGPGGPDRSTFRLAHDLLLADSGTLSDMVTHVYPLRQHREALDTAAGRGRERAVKILLDPGA